MRLWRIPPGAAIAGGVLALVLCLPGCGKFFPPLTSTGGGGGGTTSGGDYIYAGNIGANPVSVAGFSLASSALTGISGSPWEVTLEPTALAVTPNDDYLYLGSAGGGIYVYTISSSGAISLGNDGEAVASGIYPSVLRVDPSGKWLLGADSLSGSAYVFQILSGGALSPIGSSTITFNESAPATDLEITPNEDDVFVSAGTAGIYTFTFNDSTGALAWTNKVLSPKKSGDADYGMAVSPSGDYLFAAETGISAVRVLSIGSDASLTEVSGSPYSTGLGPYAVLVDSTGSYVYVTNRTDGTISAFTLSSTGALTAISGSPFSTGKLPMAIVEDNSDTYIAVACAGGSSDLEVYTISSSTAGALVSFKTSTTGTDPTEASSLAATH